MNPELPVKLGLVCSTGKYISSEAFGDNLNASGPSMRKNQIYTVETYGDSIAIKTPKGGYVSAAVDGGVTGNGGSVGDNEKFEVQVQADGSWAFKSTHGYYLCSKNENQVYCHSRSIEADEKFKIHLAFHPQISIYSPSRKSYVHLQENELRVNEKLPWGFDAMCTVMFDRATAKYTIRASNDQFWSSASKLVAACDDSCRYIIELVKGSIAFRGSNGKYLSAPTAKNQIWQCTADSAGTNELFRFEDSHGQVSLSANGKFVGAPAGDGEPACKSTSVTDNEIFQMEISGSNWMFRTCADKYFAVSSGRVACVKKAEATAFEIKYDAEKAIISHEGKGLTVAANGSFSFADGTPFTIDVINRPQLILRTEFGFVVANRAGDGVACNGAEPEVFKVEAKDGFLAFQASNGKYVSAAADGACAASSASPEKFTVEWRVHTKFAIRSSTGAYLTASQDGKVLAKGNSDNAYLFEY